MGTKKSVGMLLLSVVISILVVLGMMPSQGSAELLTEAGHVIETQEGSLITDGHYAAEGQVPEVASETTGACGTSGAGVSGDQSFAEEGTSVTDGGPVVERSADDGEATDEENTSLEESAEPLEEDVTAESTIEPDEETGIAVDEDAGAIESEEAAQIEAADVEDMKVQTEGTSQMKGAVKKTDAPSVSYRVHVQTYGDQGWYRDGGRAGTSGESKRLESIWIKVQGGTVAGGISYRTHVQSIGWQGWRSNGAKSGTSGQSKRLEAIQIKLSGQLAKKYDVYYRVHAQTYGWMGWTKNGATAGTAGKSKRLEAIQIRLIAKGGSAPSSSGQDTAAAFRGAESVSVAAYVQRMGWQTAVGTGKTVGTTGKGLRVEALRLSLVGTRVPGGIEANAHVQGIGWQGWRSGMVGTTGQSKRIEAIRIRLTGEAADTYDVYYRVHVQSGGWMAWASNGGKAGTQGLALRVEALQVKLVRKGRTAPGSAGQSISRAFVYSQTASYRIRRDGSWQAWKSDGKTAGSANGSKLTGIQATIDGDLAGSVSYQVYAQSGWTSTISNGVTAASGSRRIEAFTMKLSGQVAKLYNVWYRGYVHGRGWMDWAKNGQKAGSMDQSLALEAIQVCLVSKGKGAPGRTIAPLYDRVEQILSSLSLEQKIAQLFVVTPEALTGGDTVTTGSATLRRAMLSRPVGGIIYFGANLRYPSQTRELLASTKSYATDACGLVPLQCVDEEGGTVARIAQNSAFGVSNVGDMAAIGKSGSTAKARSAAKKMGGYLKELGFNVDLAPVADIETLADGVMARRSFGNNPDLVSSMVQAQVKGFNETGILCTAKHFPGKGGSSGDAHYVRIYSDKTEAQMQSWDLVPFKSAIAEGVPLIMVAHLNCLKFANGDTLPASLNPAIINGLLRTTLGYDGLVITDALGMGAVSDVCSNDRQGVLTIKAGADLVLMPEDFSAAYDGLLSAVRSGEISEARINQSVRRIIRAKTSLQ